jgi:hypothetical protein
MVVRVVGMVMVRMVGRMIRTETRIVIRMGVVRGARSGVRMGAVRVLVRGVRVRALGRAGTRVRTGALGRVGRRARMGAGTAVLRGALTRVWRVVRGMMGRVGGE